MQMIPIRKQSATILLLGALAMAPTIFAQQIEQTSHADDHLQPPSETAGDLHDTGGLAFDWGRAVEESLYFLTIEHGFRMTQGKTRNELNGSFFRDWGRSVAGVHGWGDGDPPFTNYIAHPLQGGVSGFIQIQNDSKGRILEFSRSRAYWNSRLRAFGWAMLYSTQFELGPYSEATLGNVGKKRGTAGYVDLVVTPVGGLGMIVLEDVLDKYLISKLEDSTLSLNRRRLYRIVFNPERALANLLRRKVRFSSTLAVFSMINRPEMSLCSRSDTGDWDFTCRSPFCADTGESTLERHRAD
jgi:hypothetical protein